MEKAKRSGLRTFYTLVLTQALSMMGSQISGLAVGIWLYNQTGDATPLTLVALFGVLPRVLASNVAGVLADRWDRRYVMVLADGGQALCTLFLLLMFASGSFSLPLLYGLVALQAVFGVFQGPAFMASMTMLVPDEQRDRANAIRQLANPASGLFAPAIAGLVYAAGGVTAAILVDLATFLVAVLVVLSVRIPRPERTEDADALSGSFLNEMLSGIRYLRQRPALLGIMIFVAMLNFLMAGVTVLLTPYLLARTGSEAAYGVLMSLLNLGMLAGGIIMSVWGGTRPRIHTIMGGVLLLSIGLFFLAAAQSFLALAVVVFVMTLPLAPINASFSSILQAKVAPNMQGRIFAVVEQFAMMLMPISYLLAGPLADQVFEPAVGAAGWERVAPLLGSGPGSGIALLYLIVGVLQFSLTLLVYILPRTRKFEESMPDHTPVAAVAA